MLEVAANAGSGPAAGVLGLCYAKGDHVEADNDKARHWFERGAELKNPESMMNLAFMYLNGVGIEADPEKAAVSYTHLDVYKRQAQYSAASVSRVWSSVPRSCLTRI